MQIIIERVDNFMLTVCENKGEKFYSLDDILEQTKKAPFAPLQEQEPVKLDCRMIYSLRGDGNNLIRSVFIDEKGLQSLIDKKGGFAV